jgi:hypothetical protein
MLLSLSPNQILAGFRLSFAASALGCWQRPSQHSCIHPFRVLSSQYRQTGDSIPEINWHFIYNGIQIRFQFKELLLQKRHIKFTIDPTRAENLILQKISTKLKDFPN